MIIISFPKNVAKQTMYGPYHIAFASNISYKITAWYEITNTN